MRKIPTLGKERAVYYDLVVVRGKLYSPKVELTAHGNQIIYEPVISTDEDVCEKCGHSSPKED